MAERIDLLQGNIVTTLTRLALPLMGTSLLQMAYSLTDMIWIGRIDAGAVAAVGAGSMFIWLSNGIFALAKVGGQVRVAQKLGAGDREAAAKYAQNTLQLGLFVTLLYSLILVLFGRQIIDFFRLSAPVARQATDYLRMIGAGMVFAAFVQISTALITTTGNSRTPFLATAVGLVFNIILDPVLIFGWFGFPKWGVFGAAVATVFAQLVVAVLFFLYMRQDLHLFSEVRYLTRPDLQAVRDIFRLSAPCALQNILFPCVSMIIARLIAGFGDAAVAVQKVGSQIESLSWMTAEGFAVAVNSFAAQNYGAGNLRRAKEGCYTSFGMMAIWGIFSTCVLFFGAPVLFQIFIPDPAILPLGVDYLKILALSQLLMCMEITATGAFNGLGNTLIPSAVVCLFTVLRIPVAIFLSSTILGLNGIWWTITMSSNCKGLLLLLLFFPYMQRIFKTHKGDA